MRFAQPRIERISEIDLRLDERPWAFDAERAHHIDAHWRELTRRKPQLYNGRVLLLHRFALAEREDGRRLEGACLMAQYKAFLAWRDFGFPDESVANIFAMGALLSADGAFLLGEMSSSTANAGLIYFPAGTPDPGDLLGDRVDLEGSVLRELEEETGIAASEVAVDPGWSLVFQGPRLACMKTLRSTLSAAELIARTAQFVAREKEPELTRLKAVFGLADLDPRMPDFIVTYLRYVLASLSPLAERGSG